VTSNSIQALVASFDPGIGFGDKLCVRQQSARLFPLDVCRLAKRPRISSNCARISPPVIPASRLCYEIIPLRTAYRISSGTVWRFSFCRMCVRWVSTV